MDGCCPRPRLHSVDGGDGVAPRCGPRDPMAGDAGPGRSARGGGRGRAGAGRHRRMGRPAARAAGTRRAVGRRHLPTGLGRRVEAVLRRMDRDPLLAPAPARARAGARPRRGTPRRRPGARARPLGGERRPVLRGRDGAVHQRDALAVGAYFGEAVDGIVERLVGDELADGGWNCWAAYGAKVSSFHSTICVLEGLLEWERAGGSSSVVAGARQRGEAYLMERELFLRRSTGLVPDPRFTMLSFPTRWYYDVLRGLDHFRSAGAPMDADSSVRSPSSPRSVTPTAGGHSRTSTRARRTSRWRVRKASRAAGTRCVHCVSSAGRARIS